MIFQLREDITHVDNVMQSAKERPTFESSLLFHLAVTSSLTQLRLKNRPSCFKFLKCISCDF